MTKKLSLLVVFLVAGVGALLASEVDLTNKSENITYDGGIRLYARVSGGAIYLYTGPVSFPVSVASSNSFSTSGSGVFSYNVASVGSGLTANVNGTLTLVSTSTSGGKAVSTYQLTMNFIGYDAKGVPFDGSTIQLIKAKGQNGSITLAGVGGTTDLTY